MTKVTGQLSQSQVSKIKGVEHAALMRSLSIRQLRYGSITKEMQAFLEPQDQDMTTPEDQRVESVEEWRLRQVVDITDNNYEGYLSWLAEGGMEEGSDRMSS